MATLGNNATQATLSGAARGDLHVFGPYTAASSGSPITQLSQELDGNNANESTQLVLVCYADNGNTPVGGAKVVQSAITTMAFGTAKAFVDLAVSSGSITSGNKYWVGFLISNATGITPSVDKFFTNPGTNPVAQCLASSTAWNAGVAPATFPTASFGPASTISVGAYLIYTVAVAGAGKNLTLLGVG